MIVVSEDKIHLFNFITFETIDILTTFTNPKGVFAISAESTSTFIAYPDRHKGYVRIKSYDVPVNTPLINAHDDPLEYIALNSDGKILATASTRGTVIRLFTVDSNGTMVLELRRGGEEAQITNIVFDMNSKFIACSSSRKTIHIFSLWTILKNKNSKDVIECRHGNKRCDCYYCDDSEKDKEEARNKKSLVGKIARFLKFPGGYWDSEWSFAQFRIDDEKSLCFFGMDNVIGVVTFSGKYYQATYDTSYGGECTLIQKYALYGNNVQLVNDENGNF
jgi:WD40 repeat protein